MKTAKKTCKKDFNEDFIKRIERRLTNENGCMVWHGAKTREVAGYGRVIINGAAYCCHRVIYAWYNGDLSGGDIVMHSCDNSLCCNPEHLIRGSQHENVLDMHKKGRDRKNPRKGCLSSTAALNKQQVDYIRSSYSSGALSGRKLAKILNVSESCIYRVINRERYK